MIFVPVEKIPELVTNTKNSHSVYKPTRKYLEEFMRMGVKYARVDVKYDEYSSTESCSTVLRKCAKHQAYPIDVRTRDGEIYLIRRDI